MRTNHLEHDAVFWVSARSSQAVGRDCGAVAPLPLSSEGISLFSYISSFLDHKF